MSDTTPLKTKTIPVLVARIAFIQPDRETAEETQVELEALMKRKAEEFKQSITRQGYYMASGGTIETTREKREVCRKKGCKNAVTYPYYAEAIKRCQKTHPCKVYVSWVTLGVIYACVLPKEYENKIGLLKDTTLRTVTVYECGDKKIQDNMENP